MDYFKCKCLEMKNKPNNNIRCELGLASSRISYIMNRLTVGNNLSSGTFSINDMKQMGVLL